MASRVREARLAALTRNVVPSPKALALLPPPQTVMSVPFTSKPKISQGGVNVKTIKDIKPSAFKRTYQDEDQDSDFDPRANSFNRRPSKIRPNLRSALENRNFKGEGHTFTPLAAAPASEEEDVAMLTDDFLSEGSSFREFSSDEDEEVYKYSTEKRKAGEKKGKRDVKRSERFAMSGSDGEKGQASETEFTGPKNSSENGKFSLHDSVKDVVSFESPKEKKDTMESARNVVIGRKRTAASLAIGAPDHSLASDGDAESPATALNDQNGQISESTAKKGTNESRTQLNHKRKSTAIDMYLDLTGGDSSSGSDDGGFGDGSEKNRKRRRF